MSPNGIGDCEGSEVVGLDATPLAVQISNLTSHTDSPAGNGMLGIAIMFSGVALICYGAVPTVRRLRWRSVAARARARVVDNVPRLSGRGRASWLPVVEFEAGGQTITSHIPAEHVPAAAGRRGWPLGGTVEVLYDPRNPCRAGLADEGIAISPWLITGVGVVGMFLAVVT